MCWRLFLFVLWALAASGEDGKPITEQDYRVFRGDGSSATLDELIAKAKDSQAVFLGEVKRETEKNTGTQPAKFPSEEPQPPRDPRWQLEAQSLWDASMAYSIADTLLRQPASRILHVNGSFHTEKRLGILDHLARYRPDARTLVVTMRSEKSFPAWDAGKLANAGDFVVLTNPALPRTIKTTAPPKVSGGR